LSSETTFPLSSAFSTPRAPPGLSIQTVRWLNAVVTVARSWDLQQFKKAARPPKFAEDALRRRILWVELRVGIHAKSILRMRISFAILRISRTLSSGRTPSPAASQQMTKSRRRGQDFCGCCDCCRSSILSFGERADAMVTWPAPRPSRRVPSPTLSESMPTVRAVADETSPRNVKV
jgi:hypothetical protein